MLRYRLDDLGWFQFEWVVQSLLKAELGIGLESWGGRGDNGIDAYSLESLNFPARHLASEGPFIFQAKFIENANAAGARFTDILVDAVRKEAARIQDRVGRGSWRQPQHYALLSNAVPDAALRQRITELLAPAVPDAAVHCLGGGDICDLLDQHTSLRRAFPQLLSLRDLDLLIHEAVGRETLEKSRSAVDCARDLVPVFVPTSAYRKALRALDEHRLAVLEGPPEMGKTSIAWMIALTSLMQGWQAVYCGWPGDFFSNYDSDSRQVFVADDAFGRTEYDPSRGRQWEQELNLVLKRLDTRHWLIWTSRKHILERALHVMDLHGEAGHAPRLAAVLVDSSALSVKEKALMLYRHARAAGLGAEAKDLVRKHALTIVNDPSFTPERTRTFVKQALPDLTSEMRRVGWNKETVAAEVREAIRNPTERMRKSFKALPSSHKWFLVALLEAGDNADAATIRASYQRLCPGGAQERFEVVYEELTEAFVKALHVPYRDGKNLKQQELVRWIHPSYRDLLIEELVRNPELHEGFLKSMSLPGIKVAVSGERVASGEGGLRLVGSPRSWQLLKERCLRLAREGTVSEVRELLDVVVNASEEAAGQGVWRTNSRAFWRRCVMKSAANGTGLTRCSRRVRLRPMPRQACSFRRSPAFRG
jgi:Novel STAND NTPase 3